MSKENSFVKKVLGGKTFALRKSVVFALIVGLVLGAGWVIFFQWYNPKDELATQGVNMSVIMSRIVDRHEMVVASQDYTIVEKAGDQNKLFDFIEIPFTRNSFWYRYSGTIEATVDLSAAKWDAQGETSIVVALSEPTIQNVPDMMVSGVLEERNNILNPIHLEDIDAFQRDCIDKSNQQAEDAGLLDQTKLNAQANLQGMFDIACGKGACKVEIEWIDPNVEAKSE